MGEHAHRPVASRELPAGPLFWIAVVVGWGVIGYGVVGGLTEANRTHPRSWAIWLVGCLVAHDFVLAPAVFFIGRMLRRSASGSLRRFVQAVLIASGALLLVSIPVLGRFGERPDNPTLLPRDYAVGLIVALVTTWIVAATVYTLAWVRRR